VWPKWSGSSDPRAGRVVPAGPLPVQTKPADQLPV
jgi:hypothetical protein